MNREPVRRRGQDAGSTLLFRESPDVILPCLGTMNLVGDPKRRSSGSSGRTPRPGGCSGPRSQRASVLECGGAPPLLVREWTWNSYGSWKAPTPFCRALGPWTHP